LAPSSTAPHEGPDDASPGSEPPGTAEGVRSQVASALAFVGRTTGATSRRTVMLAGGSLVLILAVLALLPGGRGRPSPAMSSTRRATSLSRKAPMTLLVGGLDTRLARVAVLTGACATITRAGQSPVELCPREEGHVLHLTARRPALGQSVTVTLEPEAEARVFGPVPLRVKWDVMSGKRRAE
jgi:hypothetical protein